MKIRCLWIKLNGKNIEKDRIEEANGIFRIGYWRNLMSYFYLGYLI